MSRSLALFAFLFTITGCSTATKLTASWGDKTIQPKKYSKVAVVVLSPNTENRAIVETAVAQQFNASGVKAVATFNTFPFAGKISGIAMDTTGLQQKIRQKITDNNMDAVLTIVLLDAKKEQRFVQGSSISIAAPVYSYPYYGYYNYAYATVYDGSYYKNTTTYFVESNLYDVASGKLIWTGQTTTEDPESLDKEAPNFARVVVQDILAKNVLTK